MLFFYAISATFLKRSFIYFNDAGVKVGYQFFSRCEMVAIGLHSHWLKGIDYIGNPGKVLNHYVLKSLKIRFIVSNEIDSILRNIVENKYVFKF